MYYIAEFASRTEDIYKIWIDTGETPSDPIELTLSGNPCDISTKSDGLFAPIKSRGCTIEIVTKTYYPDLYNPTSRGAKVTVTKNPDTDNEVVFRGYLTPCSYDQNFTYIDEVSLEAVDAVSTAKDFKWTDTYKYEYFSDIIISILKDCGYEGNLYVPQSYDTINSESITSDVIDKLMISSGNFIQDDDLKTGLTLYEVLEEILKYLGWSLVPDGDNVWLIDYRLLNTGNSVWSIYDIQTGIKSNDTFTQPSSHLIDLDDRAPGTSKYSLDDVYNKIEISVNEYNVDEIAPDIFDDKWHISVNEEKGFDYNGQKWTKTDRSGWLWWAKTTTKETGHDYQTICRMNDASGWEHLYYKRSNQEQLDSYYDDNSPSVFNVGNINKYCNTTCCLIQHHAYRPETGNQLPTSLDWNNYLTFFILDDTCNISTISDLSKWELPVLKYTTSEEVMFKPSSGCGYITICGDLFYQNNKGSGEKNKNPFTIINYDANYYATAPVDKAVETKNDDMFFDVCREIDKHGNIPENYGDGWKCWKMKLKIGDKYWNGTEWTTPTPRNPEPTFYINYNNGPSYEAKSKEYLPSFNWASPVNNSDFKDKVGVDGYCIPIDSNDTNAPTKGILELTVYVPALIPIDMRSNIHSNNNHGGIMIYQNYNFTEETVPWCIFAKDFELGYVYVDTTAWWKSHSSHSNTDKVYLGYINDEHVKDFSKIQLKVNTTSKDRPISKSYVTTADTYIEKIKHVCGDVEKTQEYNVVDLYLDHHSDKKPIYNTSLHEYRKPYDTFSTSYITGNFMVDKQNYDLNKDNNTINLVSF